MFKRLLPVAVLLPLVGLNGCFVDDEESTEPKPTFRAEFIPAVGLLPFGNDLYIDQEDGTVDIPSPLTPINTVDGFSTTASTVTMTTDTVDEDSIVAGENAVLVDITNPAEPAPLTPGEHYSVSVSQLEGTAQHRIDFHVHQPLRSDMPDGEGGVIPARYMAFLTSGIQSTTGNSLAPDTDFRTIRDAAVADEELANETFENIRQAIQGPLQLTSALGVDSGDVAVLWTFQTVGTRNSMEMVANETAPDMAAISPSGMDSGDVVDGSPGYADIWAGFLDVAYYLDPEAPLSEFWVDDEGQPLTRANPMPAARDQKSIPLFVTVPSQEAIDDANCPVSGEPGDGWPVVIFQHGITGDRSQMLGLADTLSCQGFAMAAIDHPLHGITDPESPLFVGPGSPLYEAFDVQERHFYMVQGQPSDPAEVIGEDGSFDGSGEHYINIASLPTSRDNLRQSVADLLQLSASAGAIVTLDQDGNPDGQLAIDTDAKFFVGHSLGGIAGTSLTGLDESIVASVLAMPGGKITDLLLESDEFGDRIRDGLVAENSNLVEGTTLFDRFFRQAQTIIDAGDPANYGNLADDRDVFVIEIDGDSVVPNSATQYLSNTLDLAQVSTTADGSDGQGWVRYLAGNHGSLLQPGADDPESQAVWASIQCQTAFFIATAASGNAVIDASGEAEQSPDNCAAAANMDLIE
ncbi:hypothetical protein J2T60_001937 [Natronospira proteinivora]|uniref:Platelet-activating factor acetylhydrolase n=1 Tax=Natronospira proteinivora TaxID=1807133 RepID=A0ABT1G9E9_9GAMM|nr:hypothetical protein [Natronospira proteinivora]MCP1727937.1 hypothetical protein [Natronospira proteinivora]